MLYFLICILKELLELSLELCVADRGASTTLQQAEGKNINLPFSEMRSSAWYLCCFNTSVSKKELCFHLLPCGNLFLAICLLRGSPTFCLILNRKFRQSSRFLCVNLSWMCVEKIVPSYTDSRAPQVRSLEEFRLLYTHIRSFLKGMFFFLFVLAARLMAFYFFIVGGFLIYSRLQLFLANVLTFAFVSVL
jgi:hypothetical protein